MTSTLEKGDWQKRPGRLFFLANFIGANTIEEVSTLRNLRELLGEPPERVADELIEVGMLEFVDPNEPPEQVFSRVTVRELQTLLAECRPRAVLSGSKQEMIHRLAELDPDALYGAVYLKTPLRCTERGQGVARAYLTKRGSSIRQTLCLPADLWIRFVARIAEWVAAGVVGNAVYDALKADGGFEPSVPDPTATPTPGPAEAGEGVRASDELRMARHYLQVLREADDLYEEGGESARLGLALFDLEWPDIRAGQAWTAAHWQEDDQAAWLCSDYPGAGAYCLSLRLGARELIKWLEAAAGAARQVKDQVAEGRHLGNLGSAYYALGEVRRAVEYYEQALAISREIGYRRGEGIHLGNLGNAYAALGEARRAVEYHEQALAISREVGDRQNEANHLGNLGNAYADLREARRAVEYYEQALAISREIGDRRGEGTGLGNLGNAYRYLGQARRAVEYYEQALTIAREIGDRRGEATHLENMGIAYQHLGDLDAGLLNIEAALRIAQTVDDPAGVASKHYNLACIHALRGETSRAVAHLEVALAFNAEKYRRLAAEDKDLHGVRESREFRALLERFQGA